MLTACERKSIFSPSIIKTMITSQESNLAQIVLKLFKAFSMVLYFISASFNYLTIPSNQSKDIEKNQDIAFWSDTSFYVRRCMRNEESFKKFINRKCYHDVLQRRIECKWNTTIGITNEIEFGFCNTLENDKLQWKILYKGVVTS